MRLRYTESCRSQPSAPGSHKDPGDSLSDSLNPEAHAPYGRIGRLLEWPSTMHLLVAKETRSSSPSNVPE